MMSGRFMSKKNGKNWDNDATFGSDVLGIGVAWGNLCGKVKTRQFGPDHQCRSKTLSYKPNGEQNMLTSKERYTLRCQMAATIMAGLPVKTDGSNTAELSEIAIDAVGAIENVIGVISDPMPQPETMDYIEATLQAIKENSSIFGTDSLMMSEDRMAELAIDVENRMNSVIEYHECDTVLILSDREKATVMAALRLYQDRDIQKVAEDWNRREALQAIATNAGQIEALDENEIDILIEDKIQAEAAPAAPEPRSDGRGFYSTGVLG